MARVNEGNGEGVLWDDAALAARDPAQPEPQEARADAEAWNVIQDEGELWITCNGLTICKLNAALSALGATFRPAHPEPLTDEGRELANAEALLDGIEAAFTRWIGVPCAPDEQFVDEMAAKYRGRDSAPSEALEGLIEKLETRIRVEHRKGWRGVGPEKASAFREAAQLARDALAEGARGDEPATEGATDE